MKMSNTAKMEEEEQPKAGIESQSHWWWAGGSVAQLGWGIASFKKGCSGSSSLMPLKAFSVASLFLGAAASAAIAALHASGIRTVKDFEEVGTNIGRNTRTNITTALGSRPKARDE